MIQSPDRAITLSMRNPYQTNALRVLCVCSIGMLRSPTLANELNRRYSHNTRSCGIETGQALVPISTALINWADEIVFVDFDVYDDFTNSHTNKEVLEDVKDQGTQILVLNVPDVYDWNDNALKEISVTQYIERKKFMDFH